MESLADGGLYCDEFLVNGQHGFGPPGLPENKIQRLRLQALAEDELFEKVCGGAKQIEPLYDLAVQDERAQHEPLLPLPEAGPVDPQLLFHLEHQHVDGLYLPYCLTPLSIELGQVLPKLFE